MLLPSSVRRASRACLQPQCHASKARLCAQVWLPKGAETQTRRHCGQAMPRVLQLLAGPQLLTAVLSVGNPAPRRCSSSAAARPH